MFSLRSFSGSPFSSTGEADPNVISVTLTQSLSVGQANTGIYVGVGLFPDAMTLLQTLTPETTYNLDVEQILNLVSTIIVNVTENLTLTQSLSLTQAVADIIELTVSQSLALLWEERLVSYDELPMSQTAEAVIIKNIAISQSVNLVSSAALNFIRNLEVCHCLTLVDEVKWQIALSVAQSLVLQLFETLSVQQALTLVDELFTNFNDDNVCCGIIGGTKDREGQSVLNAAQVVSAQMVYNCPVSQPLTLQQTAAWRT